MNYELKGMSILDTGGIDAGIVRACFGHTIDPATLLPIRLPRSVLWMLVRTEYDHQNKKDQDKLVDYILTALKIEDEELRGKLRLHYRELVAYIQLSKAAKAFNHIRIHDQRLFIVERWHVLGKDVGKDAVDIGTKPKKTKTTKHAGGWTSGEF